MKRSSMLAAGVTAATVVGGALFASAPAHAQFSISIGFGGVGFSYNSGGYCDSWGCPDNYWDYPIYYCPVYYSGRWYRGPVYYRQRGGVMRFWVRGGWRRDEWRGRRPSDACTDRFGPPLDLYFYQSHGFRVRNSWWNSWGREHNDWYWRDHPDWSRNQTFVPPRKPALGQEWDRDRNWQGTTHPWRRGPVTPFSAPTGGPGGGMSGPSGQTPYTGPTGSHGGTGPTGDHSGTMGGTGGGTTGGTSGGTGGSGPTGDHRGTMGGTSGGMTGGTSGGTGGTSGGTTGGTGGTTGHGSWTSGQGGTPSGSTMTGPSTQGGSQGSGTQDNTGKDKGKDRKHHGDQGDNPPPDNTTPH